MLSILLIITNVIITNITLNHREYNIEELLLSGGYFASKWRNFKMPRIPEDSVLTEGYLITVNGIQNKKHSRYY